MQGVMYPQKSLEEMIMNDRLIIIGAGGHGKVCADIAGAIGLWSEIFFLDDQEKPIINGCTVHSPINIEEWEKDSDFFVAIGDGNIREKFMNELKSYGVNIVNLVHPSAILSKHMSLGVNIVIMPSCVVNVNTEIKDGAIINTGTIVDHDCIINSYAHLAPGVRLAGSVFVGSHTWIGIGSTVINNIHITDHVLIGAHSLILKNIDNPGTYYGVPVKSV